MCSRLGRGAAVCTDCDEGYPTPEMPGAEPMRQRTGPAGLEVLV